MGAAFAAADEANAQLADDNLDHRVNVVWSRGEVVFDIVRFVTLEHDVGADRVKEIANPPEPTPEEVAEAKRQEEEAAVV